MENEAPTLLVSRRNTLIYAILFGFIAGVLVSSFARVSPVFSVFLVVLSGAMCGIEKVHARRLSYEVALLACALGCFALGALRYDVKDFHIARMPSGEGEVRSEPEHRDSDTRFVYQADNGEKALVSTDLYSHVEYGERVSVSCKFTEPGVIAESDTGRTFDYAAYLSKDDIYYTCSFARVSSVAGPISADSRSASGQSRQISVQLMSALLTMKSAFVGRMKRILPEPESSLLAGLIVAGKEALPKSVLQDFQNAGVIHIVVLSGYNITIVAEFFLVLLGVFSISLRKRAVFAALGIALFVLMAGASASIIRAALMAMVILLGKIVHRQYSAPRTLLLVGTLMLAFNPKLLVFDPSFQLTFLAMLALIYVEPVVTKRLGFISERFGLRTLLGTTMATQLTVLPFLLYSVGSVSVVSLVSNILILPLVPLTMLVGFIATLAAFASSVVAWPLAFISHFFLAWMLGAAHTLGNLSFASVRVNSFGARSMLLWYTVFLSLFVLARHSRIKPPAWRFQSFLYRLTSFLRRSS